jgi:hypothetical protein
MSKYKKPLPIPVFSQADDLIYNKQSAAEKHRRMGGSDLIQKKFYGGDRDD